MREVCPYLPIIFSSKGRLCTLNPTLKPIADTDAQSGGRVSAYLPLHRSAHSSGLWKLLDFLRPYYPLLPKSLDCLALGASFHTERGLKRGWDQVRCLVVGAEPWGVSQGWPWLCWLVYTGRAMVLALLPLTIHGLLAGSAFEPQTGQVCSNQPQVHPRQFLQDISMGEWGSAGCHFHGLSNCPVALPKPTVYLHLKIESGYVLLLLTPIPKQCCLPGSAHRCSRCPVNHLVLLHQNGKSILVITLFPRFEHAIDYKMHH